MFLPSRSVSVDTNMFAGQNIYGTQAQGATRTLGSASITIPTNAVRDLRGDLTINAGKPAGMMSRRHSSDDVDGTGKSYLDTNNLSMLNDILSPSTPPSPTFSKHMGRQQPSTPPPSHAQPPAVRSQSTNNPSNPWHSDKSLSLAFISSPPNGASAEILPFSLVSFNRVSTR